MNNYILLTSKRWHDELFENLSKRPKESWTRIDSKSDFNKERVEILKPEKIFIPHWSYIIPAHLFENYECIVFHMTDLPFGRGGSPLQNLIVRGLTETKISALKVEKGLDTGPIYLKSSLTLSGTAQEIFIRSAGVIETMIGSILGKDLKPVPQKGEPVVFKRRRPEDGNIGELSELLEIYDIIRMLDCEGYPKAFFENEHFRFEFSRASSQADQSIIADVRIFKK